MPGLDPRRADLSVGRRRCCSTRSSGGSAPTNSRSATSRCAKASSSTTSSATARASARSSAIPTSGGAASIELGERCGYWPEHAQQVARLALALFDQTAQRARPRRPRARLARIRRAAARHRRAHQLRAPPPALVLPDQERRPARLRPAGDRDHRARRPLSPAGARRRSRTRATAISRGSKRGP